MALCLVLAILWGAIMTVTSDRAALFFRLAETKLKKSGIIEKTKKQLTHTLDEVKRPESEPIITEELIEDRPAEITAVLKPTAKTITPELMTEIHEQRPREYDPIEEELLADKEVDFMIEEESDVLSAQDAIRILETLNIGKE
jgi:hypothetical protein